MATIALGVLGGVLGAPFGPLGAIVGRSLGALAGSFIDQQIVNALTPPTQRTGPRLTTTDLQVSTEGTVIGRHYGRARLQGNIIWATRLLEETITETTGGKGGPRTETTSYAYYANFAVGLCEGPVAGIGRIWADGRELDLTQFEYRVYTGTDSQAADSLIVAKEGAAPAYRGLCYVVFERMPVAAFGNRIPQISVEVYRPTGATEGMVRGVALIAGNEFGFDPELVAVADGGAAQNRHTQTAATDILASLDRLQTLCPNLSSVMLVVPWFGDDLRVGNCTVKPKVDAASKATTPHSWLVSGVTRAGAGVVSYIDGSAAIGGTPNDASVIRLLRELADRGIAVTFCPFMMMDISAGNTLPNPYSDGAAAIGQPLYPWRGRITCSPAAGYSGSVDKSGTAASQVAAFVGTAAASDFAPSGTAVAYTGPAEWSYRRFVLHYAHLCALAGGVDSFLVGTEMVGLTQVRSDATTYPFVSALVTLAADVAGILPGARLGYAADWTEYNCHRPDDGTGDVLFNLDPLWASGDIDFVGIDNYFPLSDWREGSGHLDYAPTGPCSIYDAEYLAANVRGGEWFDWIYADQAARDAQERTAIADTDPAGEDWVFRQKDLHGWWSHAHHDRPAGVRSGSATGWTAAGKPIRFIELGCPAVDKGANQPNVFHDPKSSESFFPHYSSGARDDAMQRAWLDAMLGFYGESANNPISGVYGAPMVDLSRSHVWAWDARPWPSFPFDGNWGDAANWDTGHWVSGRFGAAPGAETIAAILAGAGLADYEVEPLPAVVDGVTVGAVTSARSLLDALRPAYQFDAVESDGLVKVHARAGRPTVATVTAGELVPESEDAPTFRQTRGQETELPDVIKLSYADPARDDQKGGTEARRSTGGSLRVIAYDPPVVMAEARAREIAEIELDSAWVGRERARFALPPSRLALDPGDVVAFAPTSRLLKLQTIGDGLARPVEAFAVEPLGNAPIAAPSSPPVVAPSVSLLEPRAIIADAPLLRDSDNDYAGYIGAVQSPFRIGLGAWRSPTTEGYALDRLLTLPATIGVTTADFYSGPVWRWDRVNDLYITISRGALSSAEEILVLAGANTLLLENAAAGEWEVLQFATATPNGTRSYILSDLLRGQRGSEHAMAEPVPAGARVILVDAALVQTGIGQELVGLPLSWIVTGADRDVGDPAAWTDTVTLSAKARRPLSPVHLAGVRDSDTGDWTISWIRRTRIGGDSWEVAEVPLGEDSEAYRLEILSGLGGSVLRTFACTSPSQLYTAAQQTADFGSAQWSFYARVVQLSALYGDGTPATDLIWVRSS